MNINYAVKISGSVQTDVRLSLSGNLTTNSNILTGGLTVSTVDRHLETYDGPYTVTPIFDETVQAGTQVLNTSNKKMTDDVTVLGVLYLRVANEHGGDTVTIGGN